MIQVCKVHGSTEFRNESKVRQRWRCKLCLAEAFKERRRTAKQAACDYLGGCCSVCGYSRCLQALEFHHQDPAAKEFQLSNSFRIGSLDSIKEELDKCVLLCSNCHREVHYAA